MISSKVARLKTLKRIMIRRLFSTRFKAITESDKTILASYVQNTVQTEPELSNYNNDWMGKYNGSSSLVLKPKTVSQVSQILSYCHRENIPIVTQGGNTGLVGGSVPIGNEIVLSTALMNSIESFDDVAGILTCQAGCILENLDNHVATFGYTMPIDLGAKGSCHIGGNVATNAGGLRLLRYGSLHGSVLSLQVVLANGQILESGPALRKDNTGYDLKQVFIGSEGTLGVITKVSILTPPKPNSVNVGSLTMRIALLSVSSFENVQKVLVAARTRLGEILSAFEVFDRASMDLVVKHIDGTRDPFQSASPYHILIETSGSHPDHDTQKLEEFLEFVLENESVDDGILAQDKTQLQSLWRIRECIPEACSKEGKLYKYDLSLPISHFYSIVQEMRTHLASNGFYLGEGKDGLVQSVVGFGHMGDGNIHLNIMAKEWSDSLTAAIEPFVYQRTQFYGGSISAEHGLGQMKRSQLHYSKDAVSIQWMRNLKNMFDPKGILNPFKVLPLDSKEHV